MGSVGLAERVGRVGRACGAVVTRVDLLELQRLNAHSVFLRLARYIDQSLSQDGQIIDGLTRAMVGRAAACLIGLICEHWAVASSLLRDNASAPPSIGSP